MRTRKRNRGRANSKIEKIGTKKIITFLCTIIILLLTVLIYNYYLGKNKTVYAKEEQKEVPENNSEIKISEAKDVDIEKIAGNNINNGQKEEYEEKETVLEHITKYKNTEELPKGELRVIQEGREGTQKITIKKTYQNGELVGEEQISAKIIKAAIDEIVEVGTSKTAKKSTYKVKIGDPVYITSDRLSVMSEPNEQSQKVATLAKDDKLKVLAIEGDWYKIRFGTTIGFVKIKNTKYVEPEPEPQLEIQNNTPTVAKTKAQLISTLSFDMALNKPSGLTQEQFKKVLTDGKDTKKIFQDNSDYFYYIEKQYNINGAFVASVGIHESAWGTSKIAQNKNNLFGYGAHDSNPYNGAYTFSNYSESIDLIARVFVKYYVNPKGANMYGDKKAEGTYYNGSTLSGVNTKYATDKNWANSVYNYMKYLYNKL